MLKVEILASFQNRLSPWVKEGFSPGKFFWSIKYFCFSNCISTQPRLSGVFLLFCHQKWQNYYGGVCSHFGWQMRHVILLMVAYLFKVHFDFYWWEDSTVLTKVDILWSFLTPRTRSSVWNFWKNAGNFTALVCCAAAN